jgi:hypothetical protein
MNFVRYLLRFSDNIFELILTKDCSVDTNFLKSYVTKNVKKKPF